jgi:RNA polymerase sigma-70 factor (ECF subfamily)
MVGDNGNGPATCFGPHLAETDLVRSKGPVFLTLFLKAEPRMFAYIHTLVPHFADAEDMLQEVSAIMWDKFDAHDPPMDFVAWGCRIAYFRIQHYHRSRKRQRVMFSETMLERVAATIAEESTACSFDERRDVLTHCIEKLGPRDRALLAERLKKGATPRSTAENVGRSVDAVFKAMARIRKALYDCIERKLATEGRA